MDIVYRDEHFFAIDKPEGFFVHPPERHVAKEKICLYHLQAQLDRPVYPIHRLDAPTSGLVLFAYSKSVTRQLSQLFADRSVEKRYLAVARGTLPSEGCIEMALNRFACTTIYKTLGRIELPFAV